MDNMPVRRSNSGASNPHDAARKTEDRSFLDDQPERNEPTPRIRRGRAPEEGGGKRKLIMWAVAGAAVILVILAATVFFMKSPQGGAGIDGGKYQAVFFTNGQVYFGKLKEQNDEYMKLTDIFYLQTEDQASDSKNPQKAAKENSPNVQLIKLGEEIHGPTDEMIISRDQILFFENLKGEGKVAQTISKYQNEKK